MGSRHAIDAAIDLAKKYGLGAVALRNSSRFGGAGYYSDRAAQQGLIGFAFTNASPAIAPTGSKEALLGTNPIGAAFPLPNADPIIVDMATSVVARSRIRYMLALGQKTLPDGWALDPDGKPTNDPAVAVKGSVLPIGGPKGYALSLIVELLCSALSDCEPGFQVTYENVIKRPSTISQFSGDESGRLYRPRSLQQARSRYPTGSRMQSRSMARRRRVCPARVAPTSTARTVPREFAMFDNLRHALRLVADLIEKRSA